VGRVLAFLGVLLVAAAVVAAWGVATRMITMDSPFGSFTFRDYAIFTLIGEVVLGLPYAFGARAILRWKSSWSVGTMWLAALAPGIIVTLLETYLEGKPLFGPCMLLAAVVIAAGWQAIGIDRSPSHA
jgi:hypothetical protein